VFDAGYWFAKTVVPETVDTQKALGTLGRSVRDILTAFG